MNRIAVITLGLAAAALLSRTALSQDAAAVDPKHCTVLVENEFVRVLRFELPAGAKDAVHTHPAGVYVVTSPGTMRVTPAGKQPHTWTPSAHETGWMEAEGPHGSENVGDGAMSFVLVEVKSAAKRSGATGR
jgi:quercetin dioxygenase-like cupin family protein